MTNLTATAGWDAVPQIETTTVLLGGPGGPMNAQAQALTNRTEELHKRTISVFDYMTAADRADIASFAYSRGMSAILSAYTSDVIAAGGSRVIYLPPGGYNLDGILGADGRKNGILIPYAPINPMDGITIRGAGRGTVLRLTSAGMVGIRVARSYVTLEDLTIEGVDPANGCAGVGIVPEDTTQTTQRVDQDFIIIGRGVHIRNCADGVLSMPGPRVGGSDSGNFWHDIDPTIEGCKFHVRYMRPVDYASAPHRSTRIRLNGKLLSASQGVCGVYLDAVDTFTSTPAIENFTQAGTDPNGGAAIVGTGFFVKDTCVNISLHGGAIEGCTNQQNIPAIPGLVSYIGTQLIGLPGPNFSYARAVGAVGPATGQTALTITSSGGGAMGAASVNEFHYTISDGVCHYSYMLNVAKGTLAAGSLFLSGMPTARNEGNSYQYLSVQEWGAITFTTGYAAPTLRMSPGSGTAAGIKSGQHVSAALLTLAEFDGNIILSGSGSYLV